MASRSAGQIAQIGGTIQRIAGSDACTKIMAGSQKAAASSSPVEIAQWSRQMLERLDAVLGPGPGGQVMRECGCHCLQVNRRPLLAAVARRSKYPSEEAFLEAEIKKPPRGTRLQKDGNRLHYFYVPNSFRKGLRCYCSLMGGLPENLTASRTYCQCSLGFVQKYWEGVLGRPVQVELRETAISGAKECQFVVHL